MKYIPVGRRWSKLAIDYSKGVDITDCLTGIVYTEEEAHKQPLEIRKRLTNVGRVVGCWVVKKWVLVEDD